ncbi:MAG: PQQ-binding-like beta-propeller repeat protein, partial [Gammaproteobacteria bacterium]
MIIVALFATSRILHVSVAKAGMGMLFVFYAVPLLTIVFVFAVVASHRLAGRPRRAVIFATILLAIGGWALVRTGGISAGGGLDFAWRWSPTPEERLLAQSNDEPEMVPSVPAAAETPKEPPTAREGDKREGPPPAPAAAKVAPEWPGFRGPNRDSIVPGVRIQTNWSASPPVELWRRPVGPGWSSFAVHGDLLYTQEQRGDDEVVACYKVATGEPVWRHRDATRFWEANAGPGPRGTPTLSGGRVYTFGATGILNVLDAANGAVVWSRNVAADADVKVPYWGFASSPLVADDLVIVAAAGRLAAYDLATGKPRWLGPAHGGSYSSPHLLTIDGVAQILQLSGPGATSVALADGTRLWEHPWPGFGIVQPALTADGDVLISTA